MSAPVYKIFSVSNFQPGQVGWFLWNNLPEGKAYTLDAAPSWPGSYQEGYSNTTEVEITRTWKRTRMVQKQGSVGVDVSVHRDIRCEVKNVGNHVLNFDMYLSVLA